MLSRSLNPAFLGRLAAAAIVSLAVALPAAAQVVSTTTRSVGGISIDPSGLLQNAVRDDVLALARARQEAFEQVPADLNTPVPLRKVSLRGLEQAVAESLKSGKPLPDAVKYLAGLQRIEYIFVYPEQQDIVLAGPAEGWKIDARGNVVGATSGRPVMLLDDLLVALRSAQAAARGGISCSIDPSPEGLARLQQSLNSLVRSGDPQQAMTEIERTLGPQTISVQGVPAESHFGRVLVAADYRMKRIAMGFEPSPVRGLPSFLQMLGNRGSGSLLPRWWLEPRYEAVLRDADGLAWNLRGASVKAMTEEDFINAKGQKEHSGKPHPLAQKWADLMTEKYGELAVAEPVFGQLQNCVDLAVVAAVVVKERLGEKAGLSLPVLLDEQSLKTEAFFAPKTVATKASVLKKSGGWVISASGGVMIPSWSIADTARKSDDCSTARAKTNYKTSAAAWYWN